MLAISPSTATPVYPFDSYTGEALPPGPSYRVDETDSRQSPRPSVRTTGFGHPLAVPPGEREKANYKKLAQAVQAALPYPRAVARQWARDILSKLGAPQQDPDTLFLNRFRHAQNADTVTGWEHLNEEPSLSQPLPQALLSNFSEHDQLPGVLDQLAGVYKVGAGHSKKGGYGAHNQVALLPSDIMKEARKTDFQARITQMQARFWRDQGDNYRTTLKGEFIHRARQQLKNYTQASPAERDKMPAEQRFTREDYRLVMGAAANVPLDRKQPLTVAHLQAQSPAKGVVHVHAFDINGYRSNDILRFTAPDDGTLPPLRDRRDGVQILYVPGHQPALLRFASLTKMDEWVAAQGGDDKTRKAMESHFSLRHLQDNSVGFWSGVKAFITGDEQSDKGVDTSFKYLSRGYWDSMEGTVIDRTNEVIHGDVFSAMRDATRLRMSSDADALIKSNGEVSRDTWLNDLTVAAGLVSKLAVIAEPAVVGTAVVTSLAETGLGIEKAASGDTQRERTEGTASALDGAVNTLFSVVGNARVPARGQPFSKTAYTLPRANGYDVVSDGKVYRYQENKPGILTDLESAGHNDPLESVAATCPAPTTGGRARRGGSDECFTKSIADLPMPAAQLQAMEHVQLFPSKAGLLNKGKTVIYEKRLHIMVDTDTGPRLVPETTAKRITYRKKVNGKIVADPGFGLYSAGTEGAWAKDTRVVRLKKISNASDDERQVRGVVVTSGADTYLVVEADVGEFYYARLGPTQTGTITFSKCGPFQQSLVNGYRRFLGGDLDTGADLAAASKLQQANRPAEKPGASTRRIKPPAPPKPSKTVHVEMSESITLDTPSDVLSTRGLSDCSALVVLSGWNGAIYQTRTLMHLGGSSLELGLRGGNTQQLMHTLRASLNNDSQVILVGGINSDSLQGMATTIGQTYRGEQPIRDLLDPRSGAKVTLASSSGITVNADGTFELVEGSGKGVFSREDIARIFERVD